MIVRDQWYVAAFGREIGHDLFSRTICGESILFWRTAEGAVTAMSDRCVHRRFPLSQAPTRLVDDRVVCGYHGFTYDAGGRCVAVPTPAGGSGPAMSTNSPSCSSGSCSPRRRL